MSSHWSYYNEIDEYCCQWLENLIAAGLIPDGVVDRRSITDVSPEDVKPFTQAHFFCGIGGWPLAARLAGYPDDRPLWTGSCPCQPFSVAGKGKGTDDDRHLWPDFYYLISSCRPSVIMGEQVAGAAGYGWLDGVRASLEAENYTCGAVDIPSCAVNAPHRRNRIYWVGESAEGRRGQGRAGEDISGEVPCSEVERSGDAGRLDNFSNSRRTGSGISGEVKEARDEAWVQQFTGRGASDRVANNKSDRRGEVSQNRSGGVERDQTQGGTTGPGLCSTSDSVSVVQSISSRLERFTMDEDNGGESGRKRKSKSGSVAAASAVSNFWDPFSIVHCLDGKARRIEPGSQPLAHGVPARVGKLRAYGNAVNPQLAAEVIRAYLDVRP